MYDVVYGVGQTDRGFAVQTGELSEELDLVKKNYKQSLFVCLAIFFSTKLFIFGGWWYIGVQ